MSFVTAARSASAWKALIAARFPDVRWVDAETLAGWMGGTHAGDLVLLDVRNSEEQEVSQLHGAQYLDPVHLDIAALGIPQDAKVVVYCSIGYRSAAVIEDLERAGIQNVYNLEGGLFDWANQDRPVYRGEERVQEVHRYSRLWGLLLRKDRRAAQ
ncbi:MAG: rhodanese-like domain-containing protein [Myxococcales bacterium]|nr:rhodanese-like domain-containing protein [Myxococcales bacterium]